MSENRGKLLSAGAMRRVCEASERGESIKDIAVQLGVTQQTIRAWLTRSRADAVNQVRTSSYLFLWRGKEGYLHQHFARAREGRLHTLEDQTVTDVTHGRLKPLWVGKDPVWVQDPKLVAKYGKYGDDAATIAGFEGIEDYPYKHNEAGERIQATVREWPAASLQSHVLKSNIENYRDHLDATVSDNRVPSVMVVSRPASIGEARAFLNRPERRTAPQNPLAVPINRIKASDPRERVEGQPEELTAAEQAAINNRFERPAPPEPEPEPALPPYARPNAQPLDRAGRGDFRPPPGGASMTGPIRGRSPVRTIKL